MKQITIYGLLGKIYNNNTDMPKKIKYEDKIYEWKEYNVNYQKKVEWQKEWGYVAEIDKTYYYLKHCYKKLDDIVEVIEDNDDLELLPEDELYNITGFGEKKNNKLNFNFRVLKDKINELVKEINEIRRDK